MISLLLIALVAFLASGLTLFSGFGLGTLLLPVFALFFPVPVAVAATAVVHLTNNVFKLGLLAQNADWRVVWRFGLAAAVAAFAGAATLNVFADLAPLAEYSLAGREFVVTPVKVVIGGLIVGFAILDLSPAVKRISFSPKWLPLGGVVSGFFGGLSGNQGALRAAFLIKAGLDKKAFVATSAVCAVLVDVARLIVYGFDVVVAELSEAQGLIAPVAVAVIFAFGGAWLGKRLLDKVTLHTVRGIVALFMLMVGLGLAAGWL